MKKATTGKDGSVKYVDCDEFADPIELTPEDYGRRVTELIHERYTYDAEAAMAAKHRRCYLGLCSTSEAEALKAEAIEFEAYREQCKGIARKECGMPPK